MIRTRKDAKRTANAIFAAIPDKQFPLTFKQADSILILMAVKPG